MGIEILSQREGINYKKRKRKPREVFPRPEFHVNLVDFLDALGARSALGAFFFEFDGFARLSASITFHFDGRIVEEDVVSILSADETKAFFLVEILDCSPH